MENDTLGQIAFEAYNEKKGGKTYDGKPIPPWSEVGDEVRGAWEFAASRRAPIGAVRYHLRRGERRVCAG